ncbi:hypothetical protein JSY36_19955 [Bacillus sp. H-16]|uniref:hypothetical protein n=1 Tax=Alteribacter salitolerans TaxID=2912333 RepID=UPI0019656D43|nr:hypothetical protein [Alteribacter salitolerans]MBM7097999.1 hypothetical protein [Alteribacter salitolerans]
MDKKNVITIRMNGEKTIIFRDDDEDVQSETAATEDNNRDDDAFHWVLAEHEPPEKAQPETNIVDFEERRKEKTALSLPFWDDGNRDRAPKLPPNKRKKKRPSRHTFSWPNLRLPGRMLAIVMSAIIVGTGFGLMLLTLFSTSEMDQASSAAPEIETAGAVQEPTALQPVGSITDDTFTGGIPNLTVHVVQGGAFTTSEKGQETVQTMRSEGYSAILTDHTEPMYLFMGIAPSKANSDELAQVYQSVGRETYTKAYLISSDAGVSEETAEYLYAGTQLVDELVQLGVGVTLSEADVSAGKANSLAGAWNEWKVQLEALDESDAVIATATSWTAKTGEAVEKLQDEDATGWDLQQRLLESTMLYEKLVKELE